MADYFASTDLCFEDKSSLAHALGYFCPINVVFVRSRVEYMNMASSESSPIFESSRRRSRTRLMYCAELELSCFENYPALGTWDRIYVLVYFEFSRASLLGPLP